jgi:cytochrome c-type biogenesis protein CcmH
MTFGRRGRSSLQQAKSGGETLRIRANLCNAWEADDGSRTRDLRLGKPTLYRLSYVRRALILERSSSGTVLPGMRTLLIGVLVAAVLVAAPGAVSAAPRASLPDIEDEVMCPTCGVPLAHAFSPQAERERNFIRREIARGRTKQQIKDALVSEFGEDVLATPRDEGFDLAAYIVPAIVLGVAGVALLLAIVRWRRKPPDPSPTGGALSSADSARLERDLSRYDP